MIKNHSKLQQLRDLIRTTYIISTKDLNQLGIPRGYLQVLCEEGLLTKTGRGMYTTIDGLDVENISLAHVSKAIPKSVICLLSALRFHEIGTQLPHRVWIALDRRVAMPSLAQPKIQVVRFSGEALTGGIETHIVAGVGVRVYNPAKTIADCFKYRNKTGLEVALEALKEGIRLQKASPTDLWKYAKICRVTKIMQPYMEALL